MLNLDMNRFATTQISASDCGSTRPFSSQNSGTYNFARTAFIYGRPVETLAKEESWVRESGTCRQCGESSATIGPCSKMCVVCESKNPDFAKYLTDAEKTQVRDIQSQNVTLARKNRPRLFNKEDQPKAALLAHKRGAEMSNKARAPISPHSTGPLPNVFAFLGLVPGQFEQGNTDRH